MNTKRRVCQSRCERTRHIGGALSISEAVLLNRSPKKGIHMPSLQSALLNLTHSSLVRFTVALLVLVTGVASVACAVVFFNLQLNMPLVIAAVLLVFSISILPDVNRVKAFNLAHRDPDEHEILREK
jgi:uncharacterized membrane protein YkvI